MARTVPLRLEAARSIADQIAQRLSSGALVEERLFLGTSLPIDLLPLDALREPRAKSDLRDLSIPTQRWHHQIVDENSPPSSVRKVVLFAQSHQLDSATFELEQLGQSAVANGIERAMIFIDREFPDDAVARLLTVPAYLLTAFQVQIADRLFVVIADRPASYTELREMVVYDQADFLARLRQAEPVRGLGRRDEGQTQGG